MPGIAGIIGRGAAQDNRHDVALMVDSMRHDPSYATEIRVVAECNACFAWISHPDSFANRCSCTSQDGMSIAFSGECFPSVDGGADGRGPPDILQLYRRKGSSFIGGLNGLFSGLLLDSRRRLALLFNDRFGADRVYVHIGDEGLYFASEAKALLSVLPELRELDEEGVAQFLAYGSTRKGRTLFSGVRLLPGGSLWEYEAGQPLRQGRYFEPTAWEAQAELTEKAFESEFVETARAVIPNYIKGPPAVGISITGGLDTRMIMACLPASGDRPVCYTYGALAGDTLDVRIGRRVAHGLGLEHNTLRVTDEFVSNFSDYVDRTVFITDGCLGALGAHEVFFSKQARRLAPVRLTGNFGSEVFRGMTTMKPLELADGLVNLDFQPRVREWRDADRSSHPLTRTAFEEVPLHLYGPLAAARSQLVFRTPYLDNALVKLAYRAPPESRLSPDSSLRLIATGNKILGQIPTDLGYSCGRKSAFSILRRLFCRITFKLDYLDKEGLPPQLSVFEHCRAPLAQMGLLGLHKFLPYRNWFRREFAVYISDVLRSVSARQQPWWNADFLESMGSDHARGYHNYLREINAVLTLDAIQRTLIRGLPRRGASSAVATEIVSK